MKTPKQILSSRQQTQHGRWGTSSHVIPPKGLQPVRWSQCVLRSWAALSSSLQSLLQPAVPNTSYQGSEHLVRGRVSHDKVGRLPPLLYFQVAWVPGLWRYISVGNWHWQVGVIISYLVYVSTANRGTWENVKHIHRQDTSNLLRHKIFLSVGHDEYWSGPQRTKVIEFNFKMFDCFIRWRKQETKDSVWPFSAGMRFIGGSGGIDSKLKTNNLKPLVGGRITKEQWWCTRKAKSLQRRILSLM